jgi:hypothetical protein
MYSKRKNENIWSLTRLAIVGLSLASLNFVTTSLVLPKSVVAKQRNQIAKASTELPVVKSAALGTDIDVPWSEPVKIEDPFEGNYVGIFDKHTFRSDFLNTNARVEVVSLWSRNSIRFLLAYRDRNCLSGYGFHYPYSIGSGVGCAVSKNTLEITNLYIKLGEQVFRLEGNNSRFNVSDELATALKKSPTENVSIRLVAESGEALDSKIGKGTVEAWKAIY